MTQIENQVFVCLDCETTGLDLEQDRVIEVGLMVFTINQELEVYETLTHPGIPIPESSIAIHHITEEMVADKPTLEREIPKLLKMIGSYPIVGHGIKFDVDLLIKACERAGIPHQLGKNRLIDTLRMARMYGECPVNSLKQLGKHFNIEVEGNHRAMADVLINVGIFKYLLRQYKSMQQLYSALDKPVLMKMMPLGQHKGRLIKDLPLQYLQWAARKDFDQDLLFSLRSEINRRKKGNLFSQTGNPFSNL